MSGNKTYFISDLHLGALYIDNPREHENRIVAMLEEFGKDAKHIYLLGDVLDYWFEYRTVVPRGYIRFFGALARLADRGIRITWIIGNHDIWMFDYLRNEIGIEIIDGALVREIAGKKFFLAHGDGIGSLEKKSFRFIRSVFRNKICQKLYSSIHPRWTVPFAYRWSSGNREQKGDRYARWQGDDKESLFVFAKEYLKDVDPNINFFIFGHRHLLADKLLSPTCRFIILGDCFKHFDYGEWDGENMAIKQFAEKMKDFNNN